MNLELLNELTLPTVVIGCLVIGYVIKQYLPLDSKHIPLIMAVSGVFINFAMNGYIGFTETIVAGSLSGLISTGLHQLFSQYINKSDADKHIDKMMGDDI